MIRVYFSKNFLDFPNILFRSGHRVVANASFEKKLKSVLEMGAIVETVNSP